jgi:membrane associated rhomboid family serine protease
MANNTEFRVGGFKILPPVIKNLLIINGLFFLATYAFATDMLGNINLNDIFGLHYITASKFHLYQFVTYMFMHGSIAHIFFNMFALWMFGSAIENVWGIKRFLLYYFVTGIGAAVIQELTWTMDLWGALQPQIEMINLAGQEIIPKTEYLDYFVTVGASGAVYGLLLAFGMMFPNSLVYIYFLIPMKAKWFVIIFGALELFSGIASSIGTQTSEIAHFAHLGGMIFGFFLILHWKKQSKRKAKKMQQQYYFHSTS